MAKRGRPPKDELRKAPKKSLEKLTKYWDEKSWSERPYAHSIIDGESYVGSVFDRGSNGYIAALKLWRLVDD